jgi:hypothetical protein
MASPHPRGFTMPTENDSQKPDAVWGAEGIGVEIGRTKEQVFYLVRTGKLPGVKKCGKQLVESRKILREFPANISAA